MAWGQWEDFEKVIHAAYIAAQKTYSRVKQEHLQKFARLEQQQKPQVVFPIRNQRNNGDYSHHTVRNISSKELTAAETSILSKGMNFSPTPNTTVYQWKNL